MKTKKISINNFFRLIFVCVLLSSVLLVTYVFADDISVTITVPGTDEQIQHNGGGGKKGNESILSKITLNGFAYPFAKIVILKDASIKAETIADIDGNFEITFFVSKGTHSFGVYALDKDNFKSPTFSFTIRLISGQEFNMSDIVVSPTIGADKKVVKIGNSIKFFGYSYPISSVNIIINSKNEIFANTTSDKNGRWIYYFKTDIFEKGNYISKSQTFLNNNLFSKYSRPVTFTVGDRDVFSNNRGPLCSIHGDINNDDKINIIDFSILKYFWNKTDPVNICADINLDNKVDLRDLSIMLYWWTGN